MNELKPKFRRLFEEVINGQRLEVLGELIDETFITEYRASLEPLLAAFPDLQFTVHDMLEEGTKVAVRWTWAGTHRGAFGAIAPTGKRVHNAGIVIFETRGGRAVASWNQVDRLGVLRQLEAVG